LDRSCDLIIIIIIDHVTEFGWYSNTVSVLQSTAT